MTRRKQKILKTLFFIGLVISIVLNSTSCYASFISDTSSYTSAGQIDVDNVHIEESKMDELKPMFRAMLGFVQVIGSAISVITIVVIGIKYMYSSIEEKAEYKKTAIYYVIGAILIFSTVNIMTIAYNIFSN